MSRQARIYQFQLPLDPPLQLSQQRLDQRGGLVLELVDPRLGSVYAEASPLPGFSAESLDQANMDLRVLAELWCAENTLTFSPLENVVTTATGDEYLVCASAAFAMSIALQQLNHAQQNFASVPEQRVEKKSEQSSGLKPEYKKANSNLIPSGYPLFSGNEEQIRAQIAGFEKAPKKLKMKLGHYSISDDVARLLAVLTGFNETRVSIDVNRQWHRDQAHQFMRDLLDQFPLDALRQRIDYLEEPCVSLSESLAFAADYALPIALDESLRDYHFSLPQSKWINAIVLKPSLTGSLTLLEQIVDAAKRRGIRTIFSSSFESSLGLSQIAKLAQQFAEDEVPGLDTYQAFSSNLLQVWNPDLPIQNCSDLTVLHIIPE